MVIGVSSGRIGGASVVTLPNARPAHIGQMTAGAAAGTSTSGSRT